MAAASDLVPRADLQGAIAEVLRFERQASDAERRYEQARQALESAELRNQQLGRELGDARATAAAVARERDAARRDAAKLRSDLGRFREALQKAVAEVSSLRGQLRDLGEEVKSGRRTTRTAAILAGIAAFTGAVTVGMFLRHAAQDEEPDQPGE